MDTHEAQEHDSGMGTNDYKRAILETLLLPYPRGSNLEGDANTPPRSAHKMNLIGRTGIQQGELEWHMGVEFTTADRAAAGRSFDELRRDGYIESTYADLTDPEGWVSITTLGREWLARDLRDDIDESLGTIGPHLVELRRGMKDAVERTSDDAPRHAINAARELLDQVLREGAPAELKTRKERFKHLVAQEHGEAAVSGTNLEVMEANAEVLEAEHNKMVKEAHARYVPTAQAARACVDAVERILGLIFLGS